MQPFPQKGCATVITRRRSRVAFEWPFALGTAQNGSSFAMGGHSTRGGREYGSKGGGKFVIKGTLNLITDISLAGGQSFKRTGGQVEKKSAWFTARDD